MAKPTATYLVAHTVKNGTNVSQRQITATSEPEAKKKFAELHPGRVVTTVGVQQ